MDKRGIPLVKWKIISIPKEMGGVGINFFLSICNSCFYKKCLEVFFGKDLWYQVVIQKYIDPISVQYWIISPSKSFHNGSTIGKETIKYFSLICRWLIWKVWDGHRIRLGKDNWVGYGDNYRKSLTFSRRSGFLHFIR
jgi:hypothetical protein